MPVNSLRAGRVGKMVSHYPRYGHTKFGLVRVLNYLGDGYFEVLTKDDGRRKMFRDSIDFRRGRR